MMGFVASTVTASEMTVVESSAWLSARQWHTNDCPW